MGAMAISSVRNRGVYFQGSVVEVSETVDMWHNAEKTELQRKQEQEEEHQLWQEKQLQDKQQTLIEFKNTQMVAKKQR